ncbi:MAG: HAD hydrolase-like protein [Hyphomicrobiales bacterium]|nr:HAD hydrolase-like protein [Hyphomicrobiales bacterium]
MKLTDFKALTFDCYGTLIDWETGIWNALQPLLSEGRLELNREEALDAFGRHEKEQEEETPSLRYSSLLAVVHARLAKNWGAHIFADLNDRFGSSVAEWPAFSDTAEALAYLKRYYKLVILSNVDRVSFAASNTKLGVTFDAIYTAEDIGSYKPDQRNFAYLIEHMEADLGIRRSEILHTAQSLRHDHVPAEKARIARAWIDRRFDKKGAGATLQPARPPKLDFHFKSLADLVEAHRAETAR